MLVHTCFENTSLLVKSGFILQDMVLHVRSENCQIRQQEKMFLLNVSQFSPHSENLIHNFKPDQVRERTAGELVVKDFSKCL